MQTSCLRLMGKKLLVALTMEGKFAGEGLQSIDEDDDMLSAMARELVSKNGIGDSADAVWRALNTEQQKAFSSHPRVQQQTEHDPPAFSTEPDPTNLIAPMVDGQPVLVFGQSPESLRAARRRSRTVAPEQGSLFSWN